MNLDVGRLPNLPYPNGSIALAANMAVTFRDGASTVEPTPW